MPVGCIDLEIRIELAIADRRFVMASRVYCSSVAEELEFWSGRLHELLV